MMVCVFAGCSNSGSGTSGSDGSSVSDSSSNSDSSKSDSSSSESNSSESTSNTDYLSWTAKEWETASAADKKAAATAVMKFMMEDNGISMTDELLASAIEPQLDTLLDSFDTAFAASSTITLKDIAEASSSIMGEMMSAE
ncbi:MAG: hypothetical protein ACOX6U_04955 [Oscillospiraceae bacterium]